MKLTREEADKLKAVIDAAVKPEHYDGEPCKLPVAMLSSDSHTKNLRFEYTGEFRRPGITEWFHNSANHIECEFPKGDKSDIKAHRWILRAVPIEPQWRPGDWAWCNGIGIIEVGEVWAKGKTTWIKELNGMSHTAEYTRLRPLTDADWTREIGGVKVRAYETEHGSTLITTDRHLGYTAFDSTEAPLARELCRLAGIPIMPHSLNGGEFKRPE